MRGLSAAMTRRALVERCPGHTRVPTLMLPTDGVNVGPQVSACHISIWHGSRLVWPCDLNTDWGSKQVIYEFRNMNGTNGQVWEPNRRFTSLGIEMPQPNKFEDLNKRYMSLEIKMTQSHKIWGQRVHFALLYRYICPLIKKLVGCTSLSWDSHVQLEDDVVPYYIKLFITNFSQFR